MYSCGVKAPDNRITVFFAVRSLLVFSLPVGNCLSTRQLRSNEVVLTASDGWLIGKEEDKCAIVVDDALSLEDIPNILDGTAEPLRRSKRANCCEGGTQFTDFDRLRSSFM